MKSTGLLTFYISENEDYELWKALALKSADERALIVKNALRKVLLNNSQTTTNDNSGSQQAIENDKSVLEDFAVDPKNMPEELYEDLFNNIIDYDSIKTRQQTAAKGADPNQPGDSLKYEDLYSKSNKSNQDMIPGLDHLLHNVIGEEDDQEVIEYFMNRTTEDRSRIKK